MVHSTRVVFGSVDSGRRKSATIEDVGGGSSSVDDSEDGIDGELRC